MGKTTTTATPRKGKPSANPSEMVKKLNPFETRQNHRLRHAALNRKVKGANRDVGQARSKALERRESVLLTEFKARKSQNVLLDKRFGENDKKLTHEEKMLRRFQAVRSKRRAGRFQLGDDAPSKDDDGDNELTHGGQRLSDVLNGEEFDSGADLDENLGDSDDGNDVMELVERLKSGETLSGMNNKTNLTKREAMMDVVRKSKLLKMERQREKDQDEDERDRVDALMKDVVGSGGLLFRPTGPAAAAEAVQEAAQTAKTDAYERMVRELQVDRGPRAAATERTKTPEEIAAEELKGLQEKEAERVRRMEHDGGDGDADAEAVDGDDGDDSEDDEDGKQKSRRTRKQLRQRSSGNTAPSLLSGDDAQDLSVPFIIDCFRSHADLLEFLGAHPDAKLDVVLTRVEKSTSIHLAAGNRERLGKLAHVLVDHLQLLGERALQLHVDSAAPDVMVVAKHLHYLAGITPGEVTAAFLSRLDLLRRTLDAHLANVNSAPGGGGDYGLLTSRTHAQTVETKRPGGHKDGLADALNQQASHLSKLRGDADLVSSTTRAWPSPGDFAFYSAIAAVFSSTDFRHAVCTPAALLLARTISECPIRGARDVVGLVQTAELLQALVRSEAKRFAPEVFSVCSVVLNQLRVREGEGASAWAAPKRLFELGSRPHAAFDMLRRRVVAGNGGGGAGKKVKASARSFYVCQDAVFEEVYGTRALEALVRLVRECVDSVDSTEIPSADVLVQPLVDALRELGSSGARFAEVAQYAQGVAHKIRQAREPLRLQEFQPPDETLTPRFLQDALTVKRPGEEQRQLKREMKRQQKGVARELRVDAQYLSEARTQEKNRKTGQVRAERRRNFTDLEGTQATFNRMVKAGIAVKGAGVGGLSTKGRRLGKRVVESG